VSPIVSGESVFLRLPATGCEAVRALQMLPGLRTFSLKSWSAEFGCSRWTLAREFASANLLPPGWYLSEYRLAVVAEAVHAGLALGDAALAADYANESGLRKAMGRRRLSSASMRSLGLLALHPKDGRLHPTDGSHRVAAAASCPHRPGGGPRRAGTGR
jgi:AraC-like DNA-binding protein